VADQDGSLYVTVPFHRISNRSCVIDGGVELRSSKDQFREDKVTLEKILDEIVCTSERDDEFCLRAKSRPFPCARSKPNSVLQ
jgi:hypothetical protein